MVPPDLLQRLIRWQQLFDESFHWERGWSDEQRKLEWALEAQDLEQRLREAVPPGVVVSTLLWPLFE